MRAARLLALSAGALMGCSALIGVKDIYLDADAGPGGGGGDSSTDGSLSDGPVGTDGQPLDDGGTVDTGTDTGTCGADLQTSAQNCGRCGHDCQGGTCTKGKCDPVTLASGLDNPGGIALDATNVYYTTGGGTGAVALVPKAGGQPKGLATAQTKARGVQVEGTTLYWSNGDYPFTPGTYKGGVWKCTLPACTTPTLLAPGDWAYNVQLANGNVYFSAFNDGKVLVALPDGGAGVVATTNHAFGLGVDSTHAYYTSSQPSLYRAALDGGAGVEEAVGPLNSKTVGFVTLDATRFYWAYTDDVDAGAKVFGAAKADPTNRVSYAGPESIGPVGIAVDATNIYWATSGGFTGATPNGDGKVFTCPLAGCPAGGPIQLADKLYDSGPMAVDANAVYWCEYGQDGTPSGKVRKVAKP